MVTWYYIVVFLSTVLLTYLVWKEAVRPLRLRLLWRIVASTVAVISLVFLAIDVSFTSNQIIATDKKLFLLTDGYNKEEFIDFIKKNTQQIDTITLANLSLSKLKNIPILDVLGNGLDEADLQLLNNKPINFHKPKIPSGIISVYWKQQLTIGENLIVQGKYNNNAKKAVTIYLNAFGDTVDSTIIPAFSNQSFQLQAIPKTNNRTVYSVVVLNGKDTIENNPIPFEVQAMQPLKVLLLASSPNFENKFLKNWLYENNYSVVTKTSVTKGKFVQSFSNTKTINVDNWSTETLEQFDVVIADAEALQALSKSESSNLKKKIEQDGLGLIIQLDSISNNNQFYSKLFPLIELNNPDKKESQLQFSNIITALKVEEKCYIKQQSNTQVLVKDGKQNSVASMALFGTGKLLATTLNNTYSLVLQNKQHSYSQLWSLLLQKASKKSFINDSWTVYPIMPHINQQVRLTLETTAMPTFGQIGLTKIYLRQNENLPFEWSGKYWPLNYGWHTISTPTSNLKYWYVFKENDWQNVAITQKINATELYQLKHSKQDSKISQQTQSVTTIIPKIYFFVFFMLAAGFLWLERKL